MSTEYTQEETSVFDQQELLQLQFTEASTGQRFLNYLIDAIVMQYGLSFATGFLVGYIVNAISPELAYDLFVLRANSTDVLLGFYLLSIVNYLIYYTFCEKVFNGYTLGKLITGTRAIREDGGELTFKNAFLRSASRLVPFEAFSGFGRPWHDSWTSTMVVKSR
jgi:uncharacterized RDD family membrane protein YckC